MIENEDNHLNEKNDENSKFKNIDKRLAILTKSDKIKELEDKVTRAIYILWAIGCLSILEGLLNFAMDYIDSFEAILMILIGIIFIALGIKAQFDKDEYRALIVALVTYVLIMILAISIDSNAIFEGLFGKILKIGGLIIGIVYAQDADRLRKELEKIKNK